MRTTWQALAWKEWHEHKWKLATVLGVLLLSMTILWSSSEPRLSEGFLLVILLPIIPLSVLIATSTAAQERSRNTLPFLAAQPVSMRKVALAKLFFGLATCLIPVFIILVIQLTLLACTDWFGSGSHDLMSRTPSSLLGPFRFTSWFATTGCVVTIWVVSLFLWSAAAGVDRSDEVSAAAAALVVIAATWLGFLGVGSDLTDGEFSEWLKLHPFASALWYAVAPGGFATERDLIRLGLPIMLGATGTFVAVHVGLAGWFVGRYGRGEGSRIRSHQAATSIRQRQEWLAAPWRSPMLAIAWKQFRESGPLALAGLGGVALIVVAALFITADSQRNIFETKDVAAFALFFGCIYLGGFTALVAGIGVFLRDLDPRIHQFWRSRPIEPNSWFWIKFAAGMLIVLATFQLPMLIVPAIASSSQFRDFEGGVGVFRLQLVSVAVFIATYSIAMATTCLTRSAVYATVLTIVSLYLAALAPATILFALRWLTSPVPPEFPLDGPNGKTFVVVGMITASVLSVIVGWLAVRYDWGHKRGY